MASTPDDTPGGYRAVSGGGEQAVRTVAPRRGALDRARRVAWELTQTLLLAALIFAVVRTGAQNFRVEGSSMEPGLSSGDYVLVNKAAYAKIDLKQLAKYLPFIEPGDQPQRFLFGRPERGDVVVFEYPRDPSREFIKRIIGVPGDTVEIDDGLVRVNGVALEEPYVNGGHYDFARQVVPAGSYFVLGDNRDASSDSHVWGFVPEENIIGRALITYWPLSDLGPSGNQEIDLGFVRLPIPLP
jgi:signal peptidase I